MMPRTAEFTVECLNKFLTEFLAEFLTEFRGVELVDEFPPITAMTPAQN
jgi:hypothetical protein